MSVKVSAQIWKLAEEGIIKSPVALLVLLALADFANDNGGQCFPSKETLSKKTRTNKRSIDRHIKGAENAGILKVNRARGKSNQYQFDLSKISQLLAATPVPDTPLPLYQIHPTPVPDTPEPSINHHNNKQPQKSAAKSQKKIEHKWFVNWWCYAFQQITGSKYFFQQGKDGKNIQRVLKEYDLEEIVKRACVYLTLPDKDRFDKGSSPTLGVFLSSTMFNGLTGKFTKNVDDNCTQMGILPVGDQSVLLMFNPWKDAA